MSLFFDHDDSFFYKFSKMLVLCKNLTDHGITSDDRLRLYAIYRQAMFGDNDNVENKIKYTYCEKYKGMSKSEAMDEYIRFVNHLTTDTIENS